MSRALRILLIALAAFAVLQWWPGHREAVPDVVGTAGSQVALSPRGAPTTLYPAFLPAEAVATLEAIERGGPFPYPRDGAVFQNREHRLPGRPSGYYREYTVPTPGSDDRGARRIVAGGDPPEVFYYTDDHYRSFRDVEVDR
jgi:ribonuclease T1